MITNKRNKTLFIALAVSIVLCGAILAQNTLRARTLTLKGQDVTKKQDGLEIQILKDVGGKWVLTGQKEEFKAGDKVRVQFWSNIKGYAYFVNISPSGKQKVIYSRAIEKDQDYTLPGLDGGKEMWIEFDQEKGVEILKLVVTPTPIKVFDEALSRSQGEMGESVFSVSEELLSGDQGTGQKTGQNPGQKSEPNKEQGSSQRFEQVVMVQPQGSQDCLRARGLGLRCRSLGLDPPDPKRGKGVVVVAMPDSKSATGKLNKDEAIVVELRLKHI
jgi:Domain of unknown function (DUF4384)